MPEASPGQSRSVWLAVALVGVVIAAVAAIAGLAGAGSDDTAVQASGDSTPSATPSTSATATASSTGATSGAGSTAPSSATTSAGKVRATATDQVTPPDGWPSVELPAGTPSAAVEAFLTAVLDADCDAADRQLTTGFKEREGTCATSQLVPKDVDDYRAEVGAAKPAKTEPEVTVPATLTYAGQDFDLVFTLVIDGRSWKIDEVAE